MAPHASRAETAPLVMTCGDPAGIGPELAAMLARESGPCFGWIGDPRHLPAGTRWQAIGAPSDARMVPPGTLAVLAERFVAPACPGQPDPRNAAGVIRAIERGVALVRAGAAGALVTAPINKQALQEGAGFRFPGHTEFLAHLAGGCEVVMMLACSELRVVPATIHIPLAEVPRALNRRVLESALRITHAALRADFGIDAPRIAVAGLNPHAGEGGRMGHEEQTLITPLLDDLRAEGFDLTGPLPADTMFHPAARQRYDAALCMYHDQALIPIKTLDFASGVNVTLGLPFVRTSPDHGTAYDIAGTGRADPASLRAALALAATLAERRANRPDSPQAGR
ncbi:MAG: 4-hydroxythreonine-4-phosphate dehydrogenase PdxA [Pararhodobacter sp.]